MAKDRGMRTLLLGAIALVACMLLPGRAPGQIVLIANANLKADPVSKVEVRNVFTGATIGLRNGARVFPILMKKGPTHDEFLRDFIGVEAVQFRTDWRSLLFAGKITLPPYVDSEAEMVTYVAEHPSTIGYIHKSTPHQGVLVLEVR